MRANKRKSQPLARVEAVVTDTLTYGSYSASSELRSSTHTGAPPLPPNRQNARDEYAPTSPRSART